MQLTDIDIYETKYDDITEKTDVTVAKGPSNSCKREMATSLGRQIRSERVGLMDVSWAAADKAVGSRNDDNLYF